MSTLYRPLLLALALIVAAGPPAEAKKRKHRVEPTQYEGQDAASAARNLRELAARAAENGSWENIGIGRIHLLAGRTADAEKIFARFDSDPGDLIRIGRAYLDVDDWETAQSYFERVLDRAPEDEDWLAEIGAYYNVHGERERAEELFRRSFEISPRAMWNLLKAAASYEGHLVD